jgi:hypothetical protein
MYDLAGNDRTYVLLARNLDIKALLIAIHDLWIPSRNSLRPGWEIAYIFREETTFLMRFPQNSSSFVLT